MARNTRIKTRSFEVAIQAILDRDPGIREETAAPLTRAILKSSEDMPLYQAMAQLHADLDRIAEVLFPEDFERQRRNHEDFKAREKKKIPDGLRKAVFERDAYRCKECGDHRNLVADHHIPEARGGTTTLDNLRTLCRPCNARKGVKIPEGL